MLTFAQRLAYQRAMRKFTGVTGSGKKNPIQSHPLDAVMSQAQLENKLADYLRKSQALPDYWQRPVTAEQLQAEMESHGGVHPTARGVTRTV